jgi:hypothetical protein
MRGGGVEELNFTWERRVESWLRESWKSPFEKGFDESALGLEYGSRFCVAFA